jgi:nucleotide-binding universal stress UspA family protein
MSIDNTFHKILCAVDFSPGSRQALRTAVHVATQTGAELVLAHAWYVPPIAFAGEYVFAPMDLQRMQDDARHQLEIGVAEARRLGAPRVSSRLLEGPPGAAIVSALDGIDLVVIGTQGRTGLARVLLGSVAEKIVRHAPCSVMVVHEHDEPHEYHHVLCPVDFSPGTDTVLDRAAELVRPGGLGITLFHALELPVAYSGEPTADFQRHLDVRAAELLDEHAARLEKRTTVPVAKRSRIGSAGAQVLQILDEDSSYDLVVVGSHHRTGISRVLLGSVAEKIVRHAPCPVLVVRTKA